MLFRTQLSIICVESFFKNHNIFMIMVISGGHYESGVWSVAKAIAMYAIIVISSNFWHP